MKLSTSLRGAALPALLAVAACAVNPATGERELSLISESQEIQMGQEAHPQIVASMGVVDNPALQRYVSDLGQRLAAESERPDLPWTFTVIDDPTVNAFAVPGGFIYVTRGILAHFESEAELAGVLGHEIGHITARHTVSQLSRQQLQQLGLGLGMIFSQTVRDYGQLLSASLDLLNLRYSRGDETESDGLGVRYMVRENYDPHALIGVFEMLASVSGNDGGRAPEWASTHPYPENRAAQIQEFIQSTPGSESATVVDRADYMQRLDGMLFGPNPREGYFKDNHFFHPDLRFQLRFPDGWQVLNQKTAVLSGSPQQNAIIVLELAEGNDPATALRAFLNQEGLVGANARQGTERGMPMARANFTAATQQGEVVGEVLFVSYGGNLYRIMGYGSVAGWRSYGGTMAQTLSSFAPLTDARYIDVEPWTLQVVRTDRAMTLEEFNRRYPSVVEMSVLARVNRTAPKDVIPAGTRVKRIVGEPLP